MRGEVVEDDVNVERRLDGPFDLARKATKSCARCWGVHRAITSPVATLGAATRSRVARRTELCDLAGRDVWRGEQIQGAMAYVVVSPSLGLAEVHRQDQLRAVQRLDLRPL